VTGREFLKAVEALPRFGVAPNQYPDPEKVNALVRQGLEAIAKHGDLVSRHLAQAIIETKTRYPL